MSRSRYFWIIVACSALLVGSLYLAPQLLIKRAVDGSGRTFVLSQFNTLDDGGDAYFQFSREIYDGHFPPADLFFDHTLANIYPPIPPLLLSLFVFLFHQITPAYLAALAVFSAGIFLLFFWIGWLIFDRNRLWSLFLAFVGTLTPMALVLSQAFFSPDRFAAIVLNNFYPGVKTFLPLLFFARVDYPLLTSLVYLPAIATVLIFWKRPKPSTAIIAGLVSGLLFYTYFHIWSYWVTVGGFMFVGALAFFRGNRPLIKNFILLMGTVLLVSIPYFLGQVKLNGQLGYKDYINRLGLEVGSQFRWAAWPYYLLYLAAAVLIYFVFWRVQEKKSKAVFYWSLLAAAVVVWNVQVVLGFVPHSDHWPRVIDMPLFVAAFDLVYELAGMAAAKKPALKKFITAGLILMIALLVGKKLVNAAGFIHPSPQILSEYRLPENLLASWQWMDANLKEPRVVSPSFITGVYEMAFSSARPTMPIGGLSPLSNFEIEKRYLETNKIFGVSEKILELRLRGGKGLPCSQDCDKVYATSNLADDRLHLYQLYYYYKLGITTIPEEKIQELLARYRQTDVRWSDLAADYVYVGPLERSFSQVDFGNNPNLELVYKNPSVEIYRIKK